MSLLTEPIVSGLDFQPLTLTPYPGEALVRAVVISLFTWRRAEPDDDLPSNERMGWWGDAYPSTANDRIGSRLWLLSRAKLTNETLASAKEYAREALQWLVDDGVAVRVDVEVARQGLDRLAIACRIFRTEGSAPIELRFAKAWEFLTDV